MKHQASDHAIPTTPGHPARGATRHSQAPEAAGEAVSGGAASSAAAEMILRAIQLATRRTGSGAESRQSTRYHACVPMTLHVDDPRRPGTRVIRAASANVSAGGFAFIFDAALSPGSTVRAQFDSLPGKPEIAGVIRSCVYMCGTQHRIGVEYQ